MIVYFQYRLFMFPYIKQDNISMQKKPRQRKNSKKKPRKNQTKQEIAQQVVTEVRKTSELNDIIEITQEDNYTTRIKQTKDEDSVGLTSGENKSMGIFRRSIQCLKLALKCFKKKQTEEYIVNEDDIVKLIEQIKNAKATQKPYLPPSNQKKKTLVLDLQGTLVISTFSKPEKYDFSFELPHQNSTVEIYSRVRFGVEPFLFEMSKYYEIVIFTARRSLYTMKILQNLDKKHRISHVLNKDKCIVLNKVYHLKNMRSLGRDQKDIVFVDSDPVSGVLQPNNFQQIKQFLGQKNDRQLIKIMPFLRQLAKKKSVVPVYKNYEEFRNKQIQIQFLNLESQQSEPSVKSQKKTCNTQKQSDQQPENVPPLISKIEIQKKKSEATIKKQRKYGHKKKDSQVQALHKTTEENQSQIHQQSACSLRVKDQNVM